MWQTSNTVPTVSVVIATYNGAKHLSEQLDSIGRQSHPPREIVVGDDGSDDETLSIIEGFSAFVPYPIRVIARSKRLGFRDNFLLTALEATSDLVAFCDQDDVWRPDKLERCITCFANPRVCLAVHQAGLIDTNGHPIGEFKQGIDRTRTRPPLSKEPWGTFWGFSMVFRRHLLDMFDVGGRFIDFIEPRYLIAHDRWIMYLSQVLGDTVEIAEPLALYRQHENNLFGAGKHHTAHSLATRSQAYADASRQMVDIVRKLSPAAETLFPAFQRKAAINFFEAAERHADLRLALHTRSPGLGAFMQIAKGVTEGGYHLPNGIGIRWRSIARDAAFAAKGR